MYCVKCGVELKEGINVCPLCHTRMIYEETKDAEATYSNRLPEKGNPNLAIASILSLISLIAAVTVMSVCFNIYHELAWGAYVLASVGLFYGMAVLPLWFKKASPIPFVSLDFVFIGLFLLFICLKTGGHWFLSFALPIVVSVGILFIVGFALRRYIRIAGFFIFGGIVIASGLFSMLIEFFESITFHTPMFTWSLYVVSVTSLFGLFLILCGIIRPLRQSITKRFFI